MSLEDFKKYVDMGVEKLDMSSVGFVGGEPTVHPDLTEMMKYVKHDKKIKVGMFTNLLGIEKNIESLVELIKEPDTKLKPSVIWNNSEFYEQFTEKQQKITLARAKKIYEAEPESILYSLTYRPNVDVGYLIESAKITGIRKLRFAFNVSEMHELIKPNRLEELLIQLDRLRKEKFRIFGDLCGFIPPPPFINPNKYLQIMSYFTHSNRCDGAAIDLLPDGRIIPCLPYFDEAKELYLNDVNNFAHLNELMKHYYGPQAEKTHYKKGLCPAHYQREKPTQQQVVNFFKS